MVKGKVIGIFGTWDYSFWARPEDVFQARLEKNPIYPFEETEENHYEFEFISIWFWLSLGALGTVIIVGGILMLAAENPLAYLVYCIICLVITSYTSYVYQGPRKVIIDQNENYYEFYRKGRHVHKGHVHNIYIRLLGQKGGTYYVITDANSHSFWKSSVSSCVLYSVWIPVIWYLLLKYQ
ncbi:hypothetical protein HOLleu_34600 [Holothuria leucospilota]|uniref:Uncharacterized protein n=1 Tax=Holothuria leucospilota TaxID=206669 RepID=A0A9Q0YLG3_HOLLE|nr:hypothetical protein HOLleu_34600 [Holothuria leucospilota]